ncbi:MAG: UxaA family hydrolase [Gammaproteobacteria bacterium]|nr:UxaA family hydrolase [Gammaproteobacteria bacterium]
MGAAESTFPFAEIGRVPAAGDNVAIATRRLEAGSVVEHAGRRFALPHTVLEGHRFVLSPIARGEPLLSWGLPFGVAMRDLAPGEYVCNEKILGVLAEREVDFAPPARPCFTDYMQTYELDPASFRAGDQVALAERPATFAGFRRAGERGVGTRNFVVILATTARTAAFAEALAARLQDIARDHASIDGVCAVVHTEGGGDEQPNNLDFVLRTLAGFIVHPNTGAVLAVDHGTECYTNDTLAAFMAGHGYALGDVLHEFFRIGADHASELARAESVVRAWVPAVAACARTEESVAHLRVALQCGGSDAFSGISGNPLAGWVAKEIIRSGGSANLAETDELIGAEPYVLENVRDEATARAFLEKIEVFKRRAADHGASAEGNPSGGNNYRGLYNIALKSIGAARKRDPQVRLDYVIDYAEPMRERGYYFMDSPGNDLESIAGQVASGANVIFFITGNGSITNFPFVPTLKFVTTTGRFRMLAAEMDVNAGRYNDGESMEALGGETFELALRVASGERSKGELAGHAQVSIWRNWRQRDASRLDVIRDAPAPDGRPLAVLPAAPLTLSYEAYRTPGGHACEQVGLVMPTSLCSGQVARMAAEDLNRAGLPGVARFVALAHTEGCGSANAEGLYLQTLLGHVAHPAVRRALLLEHGCEKTHNDAVRHYLDARGIGAARFGYASVQMDGGLDRVREKIAAWFESELEAAGPAETETVGADALRLGLLSTGEVPAAMADALATLAGGLVAAGASVVIAENSSLAAAAAFRRRLVGDGDWHSTLGYGEPLAARGLHVMHTPTADPIETLTGLGGTGVDIMLAHVSGPPLPSNPLVPLLQVSADAPTAERHGADLDVILTADAAEPVIVDALLARIGATASREYRPRLHGHSQFQLTRGLLGLSL